MRGWHDKATKFHSDQSKVQGATNTTILSVRRLLHRHADRSPSPSIAGLPRRSGHLCSAFRSPNIHRNILYRWLSDPSRPEPPKQGDKPSLRHGTQTVHRHRLAHRNRQRTGSLQSAGGGSLHSLQLDGDSQEKGRRAAIGKRSGASIGFSDRSITVVA